MEINFHSLPQGLADQFDNIQKVLDAKDKAGHNPDRQRVKELSRQLEQLRKVGLAVDLWATLYSLSFVFLPLV